MLRLRRVNPADRGWTRRRAGRGFRYLDHRGDTLEADDTARRALATAFRLLDLGYVRIGSDTYADENGSYGLTTLDGRRYIARLVG